MKTNLSSLSISGTLIDRRGHRYTVATDDNETASNLTGPGRLIGNVLSYAGRYLEQWTKPRRRTHTGFTSSPSFIQAWSQGVTYGIFDQARRNAFNTVAPTPHQASVPYYYYPPGEMGIMGPASEESDFTESEYAGAQYDSTDGSTEVGVYLSQGVAHH
jgi:hypothetical protein